MSWWIWIVIGLALAALELVTAGFFVIFFGIAAVIVGVLALTMAAVDQATWLQWLLFPVLALVSLRLFRRPLMDRLGIREGHDVDSLVGQIAVPDGSMAPGTHGRAELRGTTWSARNVGETSLAAGQRCRVVAVHGLMLDLRSE